MNRKIDNWVGKRVWLIGASTGIGAACATLLLERGASVALSARHRDKLEQVCAGQPLALALPLDITQPAQVQAVCASLQQQWSRIDLVLVVAGGYTAMRADDFDLAQAQSLMDLTWAAFLTAALVLPLPLKQGAGGIGIVASVAGYGGLPKALVYGASKAALINPDMKLLHPGLASARHRCVPDQSRLRRYAFRLPAMISKTPALMTAHDAAVAMLDGIERGQFHIHFPKRFTNSMRLARLLPYRAYFWMINKVTGL